MKYIWLSDWSAGDDDECVWGQGVSLAQAKDKGQLIFLEGLKDSLSVLIPQESSTASEAMDFLRYRWSTFLFVGLFPLYLGLSLISFGISGLYCRQNHSRSQCCVLCASSGILLLGWRVCTSLFAPGWVVLQMEMGERSGGLRCCWWMMLACCWVWGSAQELCWTSAITVEPPSAHDWRWELRPRFILFDQNSVDDVRLTLSICRVTWWCWHAAMGKNRRMREMMKGRKISSRVWPTSAASLFMYRVSPPASAGTYMDRCVSVCMVWAFQRYEEIIWKTSASSWRCGGLLSVKVSSLFCVFRWKCVGGRNKLTGSAHQANSFSTKSTIKGHPSLLVGPPALFSKSTPPSLVATVASCLFMWQLRGLGATHVMVVELPDPLLTSGCLLVSSTWFGG